MNASRRIILAGLVIGALALLTACGPKATGPTTGGSSGDLTGVEWALVSSSSSSSNLGTFAITAQFNATKISGFSGVNQYAGPYKASKNGAFKVGEIAGTLMAGEPAAMKAEQTYLALLAKCDTYKVADGKLTLSTGGQPSLVFEKAKAVALPGTSWIVTGYNNGKQAVVSVALDSTLTAEFGASGTVSGSAGVNTYNGPFKTDGASISMGPFATTKMAGPEPLMAQETAFLAAMENAAQWEVVRGGLTIRAADGATQVTALPAP